jgi:integrase/recombinase XerD
MPKLNREGRALVLSPSEIKQVFDELDQPYRLVAELCYYTASRVGEVIALQREAIIGNTLIIRQHKTKRSKEVAIVPQLWTALNAMQLPTTGPLFPGSGRSGHLTVRAFEKWLYKVYSLLEIRGASTHSFRRSMATHLYRSGVDLESIRQLTGHKSLDSLTLYIDVGREEANRKIADAIAGMMT